MWIGTDGLSRTTGKHERGPGKPGSMINERHSIHPMTVTANNPPSRLTTLDILGIGLSVEMFQQSDVWLAMQDNPNGSILPSDLSAYPTDEAAKELATEKRAAAALAGGASRFVELWPIPSVSIWPQWRETDPSDSGCKTSVDDFNCRVDC